MIIFFTINAYSAELFFYKHNGLSYFKITGIPSTAKAYVKGSYFVVYFPHELLKKELFDRYLGDEFFESFYMENFKKSSQIVVKCNRGYVPEFFRKDQMIIVRATKLKSKGKLLVYNKKIPSNMVALPFYVSENTFSPMKSRSVSYDETLFFSGVRAFSINNYQLAAAFFREIVTKYPKSQFFISAYFLLGDCYKYMKDYSEAIRIYNKAIELAPKNEAVAQTLFSIAYIYQRENRFMAAREVYRKIEKEFANTRWSDEAEFLLGYSYYKENRCKEALSHFLDMSKDSQYYPLSMVLASECFYRVKDYAKAVLAYYYMSSKLDVIDINKFYKELGDIGVSLCEFEDYKEADKVFSYLESTRNEKILEYSYIDRMKCDLRSGNYNDLNYRGKYVLKFSKSETLREEAKKLMYEAKLKKGQVSRKTIDRILSEYKNDPDIVSLALFVYAEKNYRDKDYKGTLKYLVKLSNLYPNSSYIKQAQGMISDSFNKLLDDFYRMPSVDKINYLYSIASKLRPAAANLCKFSWGLIFAGEVERVEKFMHLIKDNECRDAVISKFYVELGNNMRALSIMNNLQRNKPYVYYIDMIFGDVNYFSGDYGKAYDLYTKAEQVDVALMRDYLRYRGSKALYQLGMYKKALSQLSLIKMRLYRNEVLFLKGLCLFKLGKYRDAIEALRNLINNLSYKEKVLFYIALSYLKKNDKKDALDYFYRLKRFYPNSDYIRVLKSIM